MSLHFNILTLFPGMFPGPLGYSLSGKALEEGVWSFNTINIRDHTTDKHRTVDDTPYGGGAGMVMRPDIIEKALLSIPSAPSSAGTAGPPRLIYLSPRGRVLDQEMVKEFTRSENLTLLCGRYEAVDQRVLDAYAFEEISIGDYILSGGETAAIILMDACIRLLPGVMGNNKTIEEESFSNGLLEYPHYTRPAKWIDAKGLSHEIPEILISGDHRKIAEWRYQQAQALTRQRRPDLLIKNKNA